MEFYNKFQREMEEHDRDFEKKYDEDLNTTLIFVSVRCILGVGTARDLTLTMRFRAVWSVLGRNVGVHHRRAIGPQAGLRRNEQQVARDAPQRHNWNPPCQFRGLCTSVVRPRSRYCPGPMHFLRDVVCHSPGVVPRHAREAVAQSVQAERNPRVGRGQE